MTKPVLLVVDDEEYWRKLLLKLGESLGFTVVIATSGHSAWNMLDGDLDISAVITDTRMDGGDGLMVLQYIWRMDKQPPTLIHSSDKTYYTGGERLNLSLHVPEYFSEFAQFALKSPDLAAQHAFLEEVLAARQ